MLIWFDFYTQLSDLQSEPTLGTSESVMFSVAGKAAPPVMTDRAIEPAIRLDPGGNVKCQYLSRIIFFAYKYLSDYKMYFKICCESYWEGQWASDCEIEWKEIMKAIMLNRSKSDCES